MSLLRVLIDTDGTTNATLVDQLRMVATDPKASIIRLAQYLEGITQGVPNASLKVATNPVQATGVVTFTGDPSADETVTIANVVFTAKASGATGNQFNIGANVTAHAANLAAAINASANLAGKVTATSLLGVVTLTAVVPGVSGNGLALSESMSNTTVTAFASGSDGVETTLSSGK